MEAITSGVSGVFTLSNVLLMAIYGYVASCPDQEIRERAQSRVQHGGNFTRVLAFLTMLRTEQHPDYRRICRDFEAGHTYDLTFIQKRKGAGGQLGRRLATDQLEALQRFAAVMGDEVVRLVEDAFTSRESHIGLLGQAVMLRAELEGMRFVFYHQPELKAKFAKELEQLDRQCLVMCTKAKWPLIPENCLGGRHTPTDALDLHAWWLKLWERTHLAEL